MSDALRRAVRTFWQVAMTVFLGLVLPVLQTVYQWATTGDATLPDLAMLGKLVVAALVAGLVAAVTFLQNAMEDRGVLPTDRVTFLAKR